MIPNQKTGTKNYLHDNTSVGLYYYILGSLTTMDKILVLISALQDWSCNRLPDFIDIYGICKNL